MPMQSFNQAKTTQATAYLLHKAGGSMEHIKMMKLLYLADRLSFDLRGYSISGDQYFSLPYGPVLSHTLDLMRGEDLSFYTNVPNVWSEWIADAEDHKISLRKLVDENDEYFWDNLSESDEDILDQIFSTYGHYKPFALVEYTHNPNYIPEWKNPNGGSLPITIETLLKALGKSDNEIQDILEDLSLQQSFDTNVKNS